MKKNTLRRATLRYEDKLNKKFKKLMDQFIKEVDKLHEIQEKRSGKK